MKEAVEKKIWTTKTSARKKFRKSIAANKRRYLGAAKRRHTAAVKKTWKAGLKEEFRTLLQQLREMLGS